MICPLRDYCLGDCVDCDCGAAPGEITPGCADCWACVVNHSPVGEPTEVLEVEFWGQKAEEIDGSEWPDDYEENLAHVRAR